jgi:cytochrome b
MDGHVWCGEILLAALLFRLLWGVFGSDTARFSHFVASPMQAFRHIRSALRREPDRQVGHNPAGGWMVLLMLGLLLVQSLSGIYTNNDVANEGRWSDVVPASISNAISDSHAWVWDVILATIVLHVIAIATYWAIKKHNLVAPMVTGRKALPETCVYPRMAKLWLAGPVLVIAAAITFLLADFL